MQLCFLFGLHILYWFSPNVVLILGIVLALISPPQSSVIQQEMKFAQTFPVDVVGDLSLDTAQSSFIVIIIINFYV